jgi:hypothetical protein
MWEGWLALEVRGDHLRFDGAFVAMGRSSFDIFVVIVIAAVEVTGALVFVRATMLYVQSVQINRV